MTLSTQGRRPRFQWQPNRGVLALVVLFLPLTVALGFWQLDRAAYKQQLVNDYRLRAEAPPRPLLQVDLESDNGDHDYRRVEARGVFDNQRTLLLDGRIREGRPGYEVVVPFRLADGRWLLVNRGWIAGSLNRAELPVVPPVTGEVVVTGYLYRPPGEPFTLGDEIWLETWPQVLQNLDPAWLSEQLSLPLPDYRLRLAPGIGALEADWDVVSVQPDKHTAYAVQWFAMALALAVLAVFANSNLASLLSRHKEYTDHDKR